MASTDAQKARAVFKRDERLGEHAATRENLPDLTDLVRKVQRNYGGVIYAHNHIGFPDGSVLVIGYDYSYVWDEGRRNIVGKDWCRRLRAYGL